jgi:F-type H+-transporting ATPase subunit beta
VNVTPPERPLGKLEASSLRQGIVVAVNGSVIEMQFPKGELPSIFNAVTIEWDGPHRLIVEIQQHLTASRVRGVALQETAGLRSGMIALDTGSPIRVPVGEMVLGRLIDVISDPIDRRPAFPSNVPRLPGTLLRTD